jgi:hypothetical protein
MMTLPPKYILEILKNNLRKMLEHQMLKMIQLPYQWKKESHEELSIITTQDLDPEIPSQEKNGHNDEGEIPIARILKKMKDSAPIPKKK